MTGHPTADGERAALVLMVGAPASGKSTYVAARFNPADVFSLDDFRRKTSGRELCMDATEPAAVMLRTTVQWRMGKQMLTVVDSTNTRAVHRWPLTQSAHRAGVPVLAVVMSTPLDECQARNSRRGDMGYSRSVAYPGANNARVPPAELTRLYHEAAASPPRPGRDVDAVLTVDRHDTPVRWAGRLPVGVLAQPWLADALDAPTVPESEAFR